MSRYFKVIFLSTLFFSIKFLHACLHADDTVILAKVVSPLIVSLNQEGNYVNQPLITGLTPSNTDVLVYVDGSFVGNAIVQNKQAETNDYYFQLPSDLISGQHTVAVAAKDRTSLVLSLFSTAKEFTISELPAPTMVMPNEETVTAKVKPLIIGLTMSGTKALVFIDGVYNGATEIKTHTSGTANFAYQPFLNLAPGWHTAWTQAADASGRKSLKSKTLRFHIEEQNPAPTLSLPVVNGNDVEQPLVVGLAKNNSRVRVFIDQKLNGEFMLGAEQTGVVSFAYKPFLKLDSGKHIIYATAVDSRGKESKWSNIIGYELPSVRTGINIVKEETAATGDSSVAPQAPKDESAKENIKEETKEKPKTEEKELNKDIKDLQGLLDQDKDKNENKGGSVNESREGQMKLRLNLVIFIVFLFLVIAWIFWVNRELIKERREQNSEETEDKKTKK